jgi:hypothetical protein
VSTSHDDYPLAPSTRDGDDLLHLFEGMGLYVQLWPAEEGLGPCAVCVIVGRAEWNLASREAVQTFVFTHLAVVD